MNNNFKRGIVVVAIIGGVIGGYFLYRQFGNEKVTKIEHVSGYNSVIITDKLDPKRLVISPGTNVSWTNEDTKNHEIVFKNQNFGSDNMAPKDIWNHLFEKSGIYNYYLKDNPKIKGTVKVN